jgi:hypothetical protein
LADSLVTLGRIFVSFYVFVSYYWLGNGARLFDIFPSRKKTRESLRGRRPVCDDVIGTRGKEVALPSSPALVPLLAPLIKSGWLLFLLSGPVKIGIPLHAPSAHAASSS